MSVLLVFLLSLPGPDWIALGLAVVLAVGLVGWELRASRLFFDVRLLASNRVLTHTYLRIRVGDALHVHHTLRPHSVTPSRPGDQLSRSRLAPLAHDWSLGLRGETHFATELGAWPAHRGHRSLSCVVNRGTAPHHKHRDHRDRGHHLDFRDHLGTTAIGNLTALYKQVTASQIGTAAGQLRTFGYIGSIASSAIIGIVFHKSVADTGLHIIAIIMIVVSTLVLLMTLADRQLRTTHPQ